jgi:hypothetical protein
MNLIIWVAVGLGLGLLLGIAMIVSFPGGIKGT